MDRETSYYDNREFQTYYELYSNIVQRGENIKHRIYLALYHSWEDLRVLRSHDYIMKIFALTTVLFENYNSINSDHDIKTFLQLHDEYEKIGFNYRGISDDLYENLARMIILWFLHIDNNENILIDKINGALIMFKYTHNQNDNIHHLVLFEEAYNIILNLSNTAKNNMNNQERHNIDILVDIVENLPEGDHELSQFLVAKALEINDDW